jgi:hypothetical protein
MQTCTNIITHVFNYNVPTAAVIFAKRNKKSLSVQMGHSYRATECTVWNSNPGRGQNILAI